MANPQRPETTSEITTAPAVTTITQTADGRWQSTTSISLQVISTWGEASEPTTRSSSEDAGSGGGPKVGGLGPVR